MAESFNYVAKIKCPTLLAFPLCRPTSCCEMDAGSGSRGDNPDEKFKASEIILDEHLSSSIFLFFCASPFLRSQYSHQPPLESSLRLFTARWLSCSLACSPIPPNWPIHISHLNLFGFGFRIFRDFRNDSTLT